MKIKIKRVTHQRRFETFEIEASTPEFACELLNCEPDDYPTVIDA